MDTTNIMNYTDYILNLYGFNDAIFKYFLFGVNTFALFIWVLNLVTSNISHMDRLWGILPNVYACLYLYTAVHFNPHGDKTYFSVLASDGSSIARLVIMGGLMALWGVRIVFVFWRRGYYRMDHEDHRWESIREKLGYPAKKLPFHVYNFVLMAFIQNWILFGHALPLWFIQTNTSGGRIGSQQPLNSWDLILTGLFLVFFLFEYYGDEQQWKFQTKKHQWLADCKSGKDVSLYTDSEIADFKRGFLCRGLFAYSRHPNYFGELFMWWTIWAFTISSQQSILLADGLHFTDLFNYAMYSNIIMSLLFPRSSKVTEKICVKKYPEYMHYQSKVNMIFPSFTPYVADKEN